MSAIVRPVGILRSMVKELPPESDTIEVAHGQQVRAACEALGLLPDLIALVVVNGEQASLDYVLQAGDEVKLIALVGGG
jgi:molybdopterin converting factor small subunit